MGQRALQHSIDTYHWANSGAFVAMNPVDGQIYAMGSLPTYNPKPVARPAGWVETVSATSIA